MSRKTAITIKRTKANEQYFDALLEAIQIGQITTSEIPIVINGAPVVRTEDAEISAKLNSIIRMLKNGAHGTISESEITVDSSDFEGGASWD